MRIDEKIWCLKTLTNSFKAEFIHLAPMARRLRCIALLTEIYQVQMELEKVKERIVSEIDNSEALIEFESYTTIESWIEKGHPAWSDKSYTEQENKDTIINHMVDILPLNEKYYTFTSDQALSFKDSMHQFCDDLRFEHRNFPYALYKGLKNVIELLNEIKELTTDIPPYKYADFWWNKIAIRCNSSDIETSFKKWKREHSPLDIGILKEKLEQEIINMLNTGVFSHGDKLYTSELKNNKIKLADVGLEDCARFSKQIEKYDTILLIDYAKLGQYVYDHLKELRENEIEALVNFDKIRELIIGKMINIDTSLEADMITIEEKERAVFEECAQFLEKCNEHLKPEVNPHILRNVLEDLYYGELKSELKTKLAGGSKYTTLCEMLASFKNSLKVFKNGTTFDNLADSLGKDVEKPSRDSLKDYLKKGSSNTESSISTKTPQAITRHLVQREGNLNKIIVEGMP